MNFIYCTLQHVAICLRDLALFYGYKSKAMIRTPDSGLYAFSNNLHPIPLTLAAVRNTAPNPIVTPQNTFK